MENYVKILPLFLGPQKPELMLFLRGMEIVYEEKQSNSLGC